MADTIVVLRHKVRQSVKAAELSLWKVDKPSPLPSMFCWLTFAVFFIENFINERFIDSIYVFKPLFVGLWNPRYFYMQRIFILPRTNQPPKNSLHSLIEPKQLAKKSVCGCNSFVGVKRPPWNLVNIMYKRVPHSQEFDKH